MGGLRFTPQEIANIAAWKAEGYSHTQIGRKLGRSSQTSVQVLRRIQNGIYTNGNTRIDFRTITPEPYRAVRAVQHLPTQTKVVVNPDRLTAARAVLNLTLDNETKLNILEAIL